MSKSPILVDVTPPTVLKLWLSQLESLPNTLLTLYSSSAKSDMPLLFAIHGFQSTASGKPLFSTFICLSLPESSIYIHIHGDRCEFRTGECTMKKRRRSSLSSQIIVLQLNKMKPCGNQALATVGHVIIHMGAFWTYWYNIKACIALLQQHIDLLPWWTKQWTYWNVKMDHDCPAGDGKIHALFYYKDSFVKSLLHP